MPSHTPFSLSIVIPAYNEESRLGPTLDAVRRYVSQKRFRTEIIVVDDGSTGGTASVAESAAEPPRVLRLGGNRGKGAAVRAGMLAGPAGDYVLCIDADNATPIEEFDKFLPWLETHDVLFGSRWCEPGLIKKQQPLRRVVLGRLSNVLIRSILGSPISDTQCGFKCFSRRAAAEVFSRLRMNGYSYDIETVAIAKSLGLRIREVPVSWYDQPGTHVRMFREFWRAFADVLNIGLLYRAGKYRS